MRVRVWEDVGVGDGFVAGNFFALLMYLIVCVTTYIVIEIVNRPALPVDFLRFSEEEAHSIQELVNERDLLNERQCHYYLSYQSPFRIFEGWCHCAGHLLSLTSDPL